MPFSSCAVFLLFLTHTSTQKRPLPKTQQINAQNYAKWKVEYNNWAIQNGRKPFDSARPPLLSLHLLPLPKPKPRLHLNRRNQKVFMPLYAPFLLLLPPFLREPQILRPHIPNLQKQIHPASQIHLQKNGRQTFSLPKIPSRRIVQAKTQKFSFYHSSISDFNQAVRLNDISANQSFTVTARSCTCPDFVRRQAPCKHLFYYAMEMHYFPNLGPLLHLSAPEISWLTSLYQTDFQAFLLYLTAHKDATTPALVERTASIKRFLKAGDFALVVS